MKTCPSCGHQNPDEASFCQSCGASLAEDAAAAVPTLATGRGPEPGTTPFAAGAGTGTAEDIGPPLSMEGGLPRRPGRVEQALTGGWPSAAGAAALAFVVLLLIGQVLAALIYAAVDGPSRPGLADVFKIGGLLTFAFHRVGTHLSFPQFGVPASEIDAFPGATNVSVEITLGIGLLLGTVLLVWMLYRAGRTLGIRAGGPAWIRGLAGMKVAVVYAALCGVVALIFTAVPLAIDVPEIPNFSSGGQIEMAPAVVSAFTWPLLIGLLAGFAGGAMSVSRSELAPRGERFLAGAIKGGAVATGVALLLSFAGLQVAAFVNGEAGLPYSPKYVRDAFRSEPLDGVASLTYTTFLTPNLAALALAPSMGSTLEFSAPTVDVTLLSLTRFPRGFNPDALAGLGGLGVPGGEVDLIEHSTAPAAYWLFLLVPLAATVIGGRTAARRAAADDRMLAAGAGALGGVVYAALAFLVIVAAGVAVKISSGFSGIGFDQSAAVGAQPAVTGLLALLWGVAGGAIGGAIGMVRSQPAHAATGVSGFTSSGSAVPARPDGAPPPPLPPAPPPPLGGDDPEAPPPR